MSRYGERLTGFEKAFDRLKRNLKNNPKLVHEMLDGPCKILSTHPSKRVYIRDGDKRVTLEYDSEEESWDYIC